MKKVFTIFLICFLANGNMFQTVLANSSKKGNDMKRFNIEQFYQNQKGGLWIETLPNGTTLKSFELSSSGFLQEEKPFNSPYTYKSAFDIKGNLSATVTEFYQARVGVSRFYDVQGIIVREENHDEAFTYSIEDLAKDMLKNFKINIMNPRSIKSLTRFISQESTNKQPLYMIYAYEGAKPGMTDGYIIDGQTGEVLLKISLDAESSEVSLYDEFIRTYQPK